VRWRRRLLRRQRRVLRRYLDIVIRDGEVFNPSGPIECRNLIIEGSGRIESCGHSIRVWGVLDLTKANPAGGTR